MTASGHSGRDNRAGRPARPGVVNHLWMTIADNEYGWPGCCACGSITTAARRRAWTLPSGTSSRWATASKPRSNRSWSATARQAGPVIVIGPCRSANPARSRLPTKAAAGCPCCTSMLIGTKFPRSRAHALLSCPLPAVAARARGWFKLRISERQGPGPLRGHRHVGRPGRGRLVRRR